MPCPPPRPDWGLLAMLAGLSGAVCLVLGKLWGESTGPPRRWMEAEEPPDPPDYR